MQLGALAHAVGATPAGGDAADPGVEVTGVAVDSRRVEPGDLFVAVSGEHDDGMAHLTEALARGAVAVCVGPNGTAVAGVQAIVVADPRATLPALAATVYGHAERAVRLVGITGTLGKTSTALLVQAALRASHQRVGVIGSLGVRARGAVIDTGMTTPDAPAIHRALRMMVDAGVDTVVMEVTSHALAQHRVDGLPIALGVFTNLVLDEHLEFHPTPEDYLRTKVRFFELLRDGAPLVVNHDDPLVRREVAVAVARSPRPVIGVSAAGDPTADVLVEGAQAGAAGTALALRVTRAIPRLTGEALEPCVIPLVVPVFGVQHVENVALAASAALVAGGTPDGVAGAVAEIAPIRRRMEIVRSAAPVVLDDTCGNPRTLRAVFRSIRAIPHEHLRIAFGIRGMRGTTINHRLATTLGELVRQHEAETDVPVERLVVTASEDTAGARDRVAPEERDAVVGTLRAAGVQFDYSPTLEEAVRRTLAGWHAGDLVLLLGAQGMDEAATVTLSALGDDGRLTRRAEASG